MNDRGDVGTIDLAAYCARIGYSGPRSPTIETLRALHALHPAAIPFENIDVLLGRPIDLSDIDLRQMLELEIVGRRERHELAVG